MNFQSSTKDLRDRSNIMSKQLIVDYLPFEVTREQINESLKENNGRLIVHGVLQRSDAKNQNGRVYPHGILQRESKKYAENFVTQKRAMAFHRLDQCP